MIALDIVALVSLGIWALIDIMNWREADRRRKLERQRKVEARRRSNDSIFAIRLECGAELSRVDELTKKEFSAYIPHEGPQPLEVGDVFITCWEACQKAAACPILRKLLDPSVCHDVTAGDGFKLVKSRTYDRNGAAFFRLKDMLDGEHIVVHGAKFKGEGNLRCYVRTSPLRDPAKRADERAADKNESAGNLKG